MTYYKILSRGHKACHGGKYTYTPNRWTKRLPVKVCESGYHICTVDQLSRWIYVDDFDMLPLEIWECEAEGVTEFDDKCVAKRIRITRLVGTLDEYDLRWLATIFAEHVLPYIFDPRAGEVINTVRAYCLGFADSVAFLDARVLANTSPCLDAAVRAAVSPAPYSPVHSAMYSGQSKTTRLEQGRMILDYLEA